MQLLFSVISGVSPHAVIAAYGEMESDLTKSAARIAVILIVVFISAASTTPILTVISRHRF